MGVWVVCVCVCVSVDMPVKRVKSLIAFNYCFSPYFLQGTRVRFTTLSGKS